jgi:cobaltochelatase CobS
MTVGKVVNKIIGQAANKKIIKMAIEKDVPILLRGETGTGKSSIMREISETVNIPLSRVNLNGQTSVDEFVGKWLVKDGATYWVDGVLISAMKKGHIIIVEEINAALPEILFVLHSLLDDNKCVTLTEKDGEIIHPHPDFRFIATCNPSEEYVGTKELNKAFISRFACVLEFNYPDAKTEAKILINRTGISAFDASGLAYYAKEIRNLKARNDIYFTLSTRDLLNWATFLSDLGNKEAFEVTVLNKANSEDREELKRIFKFMFTAAEATYNELNRSGFDDSSIDGYIIDEETPMEVMF